MPNSPLIAKAYDAGLIKVTDISDGVVGDLSTFRGTLQAYIALNVKALNQYQDDKNPFKDHSC